MRDDAAVSEPSVEICLPLVGQVSDQTVLLLDGAVMAIGHVNGIAFVTRKPEMRNAGVSFKSCGRTSLAGRTLAERPFSKESLYTNPYLEHRQSLSNPVSSFISTD